MFVGAALVEMGLIVLDVSNEVYLQFAEEAVALLTGGRVGYLSGPQSHQLVGEYHGAPSAVHSGSGAVVLAGLEVREALEYDALADVETVG